MAVMKPRSGWTEVIDPLNPWKSEWSLDGNSLMEDIREGKYERVARERLKQIRQSSQPRRLNPRDLPDTGFYPSSPRTPVEKKPRAPAVDMLGPMTRKITFEDEK